VILGSDGLLYYCKNSRSLGSCRERSAYEIYFDENNLSYREESLIKGNCYFCPPNTYNWMEMEKDLFKFIKFLLFIKKPKVSPVHFESEIKARVD
jgi:hypothetical protein